jgi:hypothetical protein
MSTSATSSVGALFRAAVIETDACERPGTTSRTFGRWFLRRLHRFFDGLPEAHSDVDLEVLKRVPTPI